MKALEAFCKAKNYQGGTLAIMEKELDEEPSIIETVYLWGVREAKDRRHGNCIANYPVPINSWSPQFSSDCIISYLKGIKAGLK